MLARASCDKRQRDFNETLAATGLWLSARAATITTTTVPVIIVCALRCVALRQVKLRAAVAAVLPGFGLLEL